MLKHFIRRVIMCKRGSWAATAAAVAGVGGSLISNAMNNSKGGQTGQTVYNFNDPQDLVMRQQSQAFMANALAGIQNGQGPSWMNNTLNPMQQYLMQQNQQQMFGYPGMPGGSIADVAQSEGAAMGVGGAAAMAPMNNALAQYGTRMNGINQYINSLKYNTMNTEANQFPAQLYNTAQPRNQIAYNNVPGRANTAPQLNLSSLGGNNGLLTKGLQNLFAPNTGVAGAPGGYVPAQVSTPEDYSGTVIYPGNQTPVPFANGAPTGVYTNYQ